VKRNRSLSFSGRTTLSCSATSIYVCIYLYLYQYIYIYIYVHIYKRIYTTLPYYLVKRNRSLSFFPRTTPNCAATSTYVSRSISISISISISDLSLYRYLHTIPHYCITLWSETGHPRSPVERLLAVRQPPGLPSGRSLPA